MILRLEVNEIGNVIGGSTLSFTRIVQTRTGRANRFFLAAQTVAIERAHFEVIEKQRGAIVFLPLPVVERRQRRRETVFVRGNARFVTILKRQGCCLYFTCQATFDQRSERRGEEQLSRRIRFERRANPGPRITPAFLRDAKLTRRDVEKRGANTFAGATNRS